MALKLFLLSAAEVVVKGVWPSVDFAIICDFLPRAPRLRNFKDPEMDLRLGHKQQGLGKKVEQWGILVTHQAKSLATVSRD